MAKRSHLYSYHKENGKLTEFSGFEMPLWYRGIIEEHNAVRNAAGIFDVSHMGRVSIRGAESDSFLNHVLPSDARMVKIDRAFYSTICNDSGGIVDDVVTSKIAQHEYLMVVNAGNRAEDWRWLEDHAHDYAVELVDLSEGSALIAIQGPLALPVLQKHVRGPDISLVKRFGVVRCEVENIPCLVSRTGYTGEDGFEIAIMDAPLDEPSKALRIWEALLETGKDSGVLPCGLGARDSLRLEAGMCLYGNDIDDATTPIEADLGYVVSKEKDEKYPGREVIERQLKDGVKRKRVAFSMLVQGIPRQGYGIQFSGTRVGTVTSGSFSPTMKKGIGMGYVPPELSGKGRTISVQLKAASQPASIVGTPFYDTKIYGYRRSAS